MLTELTRLLNALNRSKLLALAVFLVVLVFLVWQNIGAVKSLVVNVVTSVPQKPEASESVSGDESDSQIKTRLNVVDVSMNPVRFPDLNFVYFRVEHFSGPAAKRVQIAIDPGANEIVARNARSLRDCKFEDAASESIQLLICPEMNEHDYVDVVLELTGPGLSLLTLSADDLGPIRYDSEALRDIAAPTADTAEQILGFFLFVGGAAFVVATVLLLFKFGGWLFRDG